MSAAAAAETLYCRPVWWATPPSSAPSLPWCTTATASSTVSETTGGRDPRRDSWRNPSRAFHSVQQRFKGQQRRTEPTTTQTGSLSLSLTSGSSSRSRRGNPAVTLMPCRCLTASPVPCTRCTTWPPRPSCRQNGTGRLELAGGILPQCRVHLSVQTAGLSELVVSARINATVSIL